MSFTIAANPHCEDDPLLVKEASDPEPAVGTPAMNDAHTYMMSQDTKGISSSINEETFTFTIQSLVNNTARTKHRRNTCFGPTSADKDFASQFAGEGISGHLRRGREVDAARCTGRDTCGRR
eukprot:6965170-Pyramimonas_sp.AAC.1